jgi:glutamine amidotransferase
MIVVIDYDVGNVKSVCNAFRYIGCSVQLSRQPEVIRQAAGLVLPGVAAFGYAINALGDLASIVKEIAAEGRPLLGICVGFQMLFDKSHEYGLHKGLGLISGDVVPLPKDRTVPHMGWNLVTPGPDMDLFEGLRAPKHFYFAHSYYAAVTDRSVQLAHTEYGFDLAAAIQKGNIFGTQFHPEKSGPSGLTVLRNFAAVCERSDR